MDQDKLSRKNISQQVKDQALGCRAGKDHQKLWSMNINKL
jgi:hypothetical protein